MSRILRACPVCREVFAAESKAEVDDAVGAHLEAEFREYFEEEVAAGRMVRVERDGKTGYLPVKPGSHEPQERP